MTEDSYKGEVSDPLSLNLYTYCNNNPVMYKDPSGNFAVIDDAATVYIVYAGGTVAVTTWGWLSSPEGKKAMKQGAVVVYKGSVIAGKVVTKAAKYAINGLVNGAKWVGEKISDGANWVGGIATNGWNKIAGLFSKPSNRPSYKKVRINMGHIMSGHGAGGNRGGPNKDRFPWEMTAPMIEKSVREAYRNAEKIGSLQTSWENGVEMVKQEFQGPWWDKIIQFWYNYTTKTIETAWPK